MPTLLPYRYSLDYTGTSVDNLVVGEPHAPANYDIRSIAPIYGPYFTESLKVYNTANEELLFRNISYQCVDVVGLPTAKTGKEICTIILLTDKSIREVKIDYQTLGGAYERRYEAIRLLMENLNLNKDLVTWRDIVDKPSEFDPTMHLHAIGDVIGFEYLVVALEQIRNAIILGDDNEHMELFNQLNNIKTVIDGILNNPLIALTNDLNTNASQTLTLANQINVKCDQLLYNAALILSKM